jgi:hypothetical protein
VFEHRPAIEADAGDAADSEINRQHVALISGGIIARRVMDRAYRTVGKSFGVEAGGGLGVFVVLNADRVFGGCHYLSFHL